MSEGKKKEIQAVVDQADKLDKYIHQYVSRSLRLHDALGEKGTKILNDLFSKIEKLDMP